VEATGGLETLFDDLLIVQIRKVTGADELSARYMLGLHRGTVTGDVEIAGRPYSGTPAVKPEPAEKLEVTALHWWPITTGVQDFVATVRVSVTGDDPNDVPPMVTPKKTAA
jgi:hypothetical protein